MQRFTKIEAWCLAHDFIVKLYKVTKGFPKEEKFGGMTSQVTRAAVSVATNIAEGSKRVNRTDYARFLNIAEGSPAETQCLLILSRSLQFAPAKPLNELLEILDPIAGKLHRLREAVERGPVAPMRPKRRISSHRSRPHRRPSR